MRRRSLFLSLLPPVLKPAPAMKPHCCRVTTKNHKRKITALSRGSRKMAPGEKKSMEESLFFFPSCHFISRHANRKLKPRELRTCGYRNEEKGPLKPECRRNRGERGGEADPSLCMNQVLGSPASCACVQHSQKHRRSFQNRTTVYHKPLPKGWTT